MGKPRSRIKLFLSIELSGALSRLRLRNLSLSDSGFRLSSQATTVVARLVLRPATVAVNRRTLNGSRRDRMQNITLPFSLIYLDAIPKSGSANSGHKPVLFFTWIRDSGVTSSKSNDDCSLSSFYYAMQLSQIHVTQTWIIKYEAL